MRKRHIWTPQEIEILRQKYPLTNNKLLAEQLGVRVVQLYDKAQDLGLRKDAAYFTAENGFLVKGMSIPGSERTQFKKGHVSANKGLKQTDYMTPEQIERSKSTQFKKGQRSHNHKPVGYIRILQDGYVEIKTAEPGTFELLHRVVWTQHHGAIPDGHKIRFKDGNRQNCDIDNLELISNGDMLRHNYHARYPIEVRQLMQLKGALKRQINKYSKKQNK